MTREDLWVSGRTGFTSDAPLHQKNLRQIEDYINNVILEEELGAESIEDFQILSLTISKLTAGDLSADALITSGSIRTGDTGTRRVEFDSLGIRLIDDDETVLFEISTVGDSSTASDIDGTVNVNDSVLLAAAVATPTTAPSASTVNDYISFAVGYGERQGAYYDSTLGHYFFVNQNYAGTSPSNFEFKKVDTSGTVVDEIQIVSSAHDLGCVYIPSTDMWYIALVYADELYWRIQQNSAFDMPTTSGFQATVFRESPILSINAPTHIGSLTTDGTSLFLSYVRTSDNKPVFRTYTPGATTVTNTAEVVGDTAMTGNGTYYRVDSYFRGNADFGSVRHIIGDIGDPNFRVFNGSGVRQAAEEWPRATTGSYLRPGGGLVYVGGQFKEITSSDLSRLVTHAPSDIPAATYQLAYSFYDSDATGGTHESALSPRREIEVFERQAINLSWQAPPDGGGTDDPDTVRLYMVAAGADPGAAFGSYFRQGTTFAGTSTTLTSYDTGTPGVQDTAFAGSGAPGALTTEDAGFSLTGDGALVLPTFNGAPSSPTQGQIYYDTSDDITYVWDGAAWQALYP